MTLRRFVGNILQDERLNFVLTNRIPRRLLTHCMGWFSRIQHPFIRIPSIAVFRFFADDLELESAQEQVFSSLHACFIRRLKPDARPICDDPSILVSPCDAIVGEAGPIQGTAVFQAKGHGYSLAELLIEEDLVRTFAGGTYATLRLKASMYHRFHAPHALSVEGMTYVSGDVWNVNPTALRRVPGLYTKNERAILRLRLRSGEPLALVPVAAVLVASMRFTFTDVRLHLRYAGPNEIPCSGTLEKGAEMGHFEHGSTILVFAPPGFELLPDVGAGHLIRMGQPLMRRCAAGASAKGIETGRLSQSRSQGFDGMFRGSLAS